MSTKKDIKQKEQEIIDLARKLCLENINDEYAELSEKMIRKMGRKKQVPFEGGKSEIWATAVVHALGMMNFLFDNSFLPYITFDKLCSYYGTNKSTIGGKSLDIRKILNLRQYDEEYSTKYIKKNNPWDRIGKTLDGLLFHDDDFEDDLEDEDDMLDMEDDFFDQSLLDSVAILVRPRQPFIDWMNKVYPEDNFELKDFAAYNTYLVADDDIAIEEEELEQLVFENYKEIFETELNSAIIETDEWPEEVSFELFKDWFEYLVSAQVFNLNQNIEDDVF